MKLKFFDITKKGNGDTPAFSRPVYREKKKIRTKLKDYLPWSYFLRRFLYIDSETRLETCIIIHKDDSIQQIYGFRGNDIESFAPEYIAAVFENFNSQIKRLGEGWMVSVESQNYQIHDYPAGDFSSVASLLIDQERSRDFRESGEHYDSNCYLNFVYKPENEIKRKAVKYLFKEQETKNELSSLCLKEVTDFEKKVLSITSVLASRLVIRPLDVEESVLYLHSTCSTKRHKMIIPEQFMFLDSFISDQELEIGKTLKLGEHYIPICEILDFPTRTYPAILNELNKLNIEYRWVSRFICMDKKEALHEFDNYQKDAASSKKSTKKLASEMMFGYESNLENKSGQFAQSDVEEAMIELGGDINGFGFYQSGVMVWDTDYETALRKIRDVITCIEDAGFNAKESELGAFDSFLGLMAGNYTANIRRPMISTGNYTHTLPFTAIWAGMEHNKHLGGLVGVDLPLITCTTNYGSNFYLNLNDGDVGHTLILGPTGAGKSTLLNLIAASSQKYPDSQVFFMDYGLSALTLTLAVGGTYVDPSNRTVCFQPLRNVDNEEEFIWSCEYIENILQIQGLKIEPRMHTAIEAAMRSLTVMPVEMRTITTFRLNLQYVDEKGNNILDDALKSYCIDGKYGHIFDGNRTSLTESRWVLFEMQQIMEYGKECSAPAILFIFHYLEKNFTGRLTFFIMDECWFGLESEAIRKKMKEYLLTLRKKNVFCIFATQNPAVIASSPLAPVMIQNCPTKIYLADPDAIGIAEEYEKLGLSYDEVCLLAQCTKKMDYYYKSNMGTRKFQLNLGVIELAFFKNYESKFKDANGKIIDWKLYLQYLMKLREEYGYDRAFPDKILDILGIKFRPMLEGINWEESL